MIINWHYRVNHFLYQNRIPITVERVCHSPRPTVCPIQNIQKLCKIYLIHLPMRGPGSSVGIATDYGLDGPEIESRWGQDFSTRPDRPWGPPSQLYNGYRVFPGGRKRENQQPPHVSSCICWSSAFAAQTAVGICVRINVSWLCYECSVLYSQ
jgi:hypothetical protein